MKKAYFQLNNKTKCITANQKAAVDASWNMQDADFWILGKGNKKDIGRPTRDQAKVTSSYIGLKVLTPEKIIPQYLYYLFEHLFHQGEFAKLSKGTINLQHITLTDIRSILNRLQFSK